MSLFGEKIILIKDIVNIKYVSICSRINGIKVNEVENCHIYVRNSRSLTFGDNLNDFEKFKSIISNYVKFSNSGKDVVHNFWTCKKCGDANKLLSSACKSCGNYK